MDGLRRDTLEELIADVESRWPNLEFQLGRLMNTQGKPVGWYADLGWIRETAVTPESAIRRVIDMMARMTSK